MIAKRIRELENELDKLKKNKNAYIKDWEEIKYKYMESYNIATDCIRDELDMFYDNMVKNNDFFYELLDKYIKTNPNIMKNVAYSNKLHLNNKDEMVVGVNSDLSFLEIIIHRKDEMTLVHKKSFESWDNKYEINVLDGYYNLTTEYREGVEYYRCDYRK